MSKKMNTELQKTYEFINAVLAQHRRINPCFMTGKGCIYTEQIDREIEKRHKSAIKVQKKIKEIINYDLGEGVNEKEEHEEIIKKINDIKLDDDKTGKPISGFSITPFEPNFLTFYKLCLYRYVTGGYLEQINLERADSVRKTGYVICEKIVYIFLVFHLYQ